jgi:hypothetical protein
MLEVQLFPLVPNAVLPVPAPAATRPQVPPGYGVQEHCLPFTAATALGFLIKSPITFGLCLPSEVPAGCHPFRSPLERPGDDGTFEDMRVFYVKDHPECRFIKNAFTQTELDDGTKASPPRLHPGLSFFDRQDQLDVFKIHLPYIWRTPPEVDALFILAINLPSSGFTLLSGLVETDWYGNAVNMVFRKPAAGSPVHIATGTPLAQVIFLPRSYRRPELKVLASHARSARDLRATLAEWHQLHTKDRSAYKKLARSQHGRVNPKSKPPTE